MKELSLELAVRAHCDSSSHTVCSGNQARVFLIHQVTGDVGPEPEPERWPRRSFFSKNIRRVEQISRNASLRCRAKFGESRTSVRTDEMKIEGINSGQIGFTVQLPPRSSAAASTGSVGAFRVGLIKTTTPRSMIRTTITVLGRLRSLHPIMGVKRARPRS